MPIPIWTRTCISGMVGGGVRGKVAGIAPIIMTGAGVITTASPGSILMWTPVGEDTTETIIGVGIGGTMNVFPSDGFDRTGVPGITSGIGKGEGTGASRTIDLGRNGREKNSEGKGSGITVRGPTSSGMSKKDEGTKEGIESIDSEVGVIESSKDFSCRPKEKGPLMINQQSLFAFLQHFKRSARQK